MSLPERLFPVSEPIRPDAPAEIPVRLPVGPDIPPAEVVAQFEAPQVQGSQAPKIIGRQLMLWTQVTQA